MGGGSQVGKLVGWLVGWLVGGLVGCLLGWLAGWCGKIAVFFGCLDANASGNGKLHNSNISSFCNFFSDGQSL